VLAEAVVFVNVTASGVMSLPDAGAPFGAVHEYGRAPPDAAICTCCPETAF
jgi:hypothetical protein